MTTPGRLLMAADVVQLDMTHALVTKTRQGTDLEKRMILFQRLLFAMVTSVFSGLALFLLGQVLIARRTYSRAVELIDSARRAGLYNGPSGTRTAFAFHMGRVGALLAGFDNVYLPSALIIMCYEQQWQAVFDRADGGIQQWFACVHKIGSENSNLSPDQIFCQALSCSQDHTQTGCPVQTLSCPNVIACLPLCNPTAYVQTGSNESIAMSGVNGLLSGAGSGVAAAIVVTNAFPPTALIIGVAALIGGLFSTAAAIERSKEIHRQCVASRAHCVQVAGAPACGGITW